MSAFRQRRIWFWIAVAALAIAVIALMAPHAGNTADQPAWLGLLPVFFIGLIAPFGLLFLQAILCIERVPNAPTLAPSFQRPPPSQLA